MGRNNKLSKLINHLDRIKVLLKENRIPKIANLPVPLWFNWFKHLIISFFVILILMLTVSKIGMYGLLYIPTYSLLDTTKIELFQKVVKMIKLNCREKIFYSKHGNLFELIMLYYKANYHYREVISLFLAKKWETQAHTQCFVYLHSGG